MIVAMGDSITYAQGVTGKRWTEILSELIGERVLNRGTMGDTTRLALERFPDAVQRYLPGDGNVRVLLQFGMNDANEWQTDEGMPRVSGRAFSANLHEMVDRVLHFGGIPVLVTAPPSLREQGMPSGISYEAANEKYAGIVRRVAAASSVTLIDLREALRDAPREQFIQPDGLHPNHLGQILIAEACAGVLAPKAVAA